MPGKSVDGQPPPGFKLRHTLRGHKGRINRIAWSPNGRFLASPSFDKTIRLWDAETGDLYWILKGHTQAVFSVAWSPDERTIASASADNTIQLWDVGMGELRRTLVGHLGAVYSVVWSPDGRMIASGSADKTVRLWDVEAGEPRQTLERHSDWVNSVAWLPGGRTLASASEDGTIRLWDTETGTLCQTFVESLVWSVAWSPDGRTLASASEDGTVRLWDSGVGRPTSVLEGHIDSVTHLSFSSDGRLLASKSFDGTVRIWHCDIRETVAVLDEPASDNWYNGLAFDSRAPVLATLGEKDTVIRIWDLNLDVLLGVAPVTPSVHYTNAKVVLVGDTGVGKTGLVLVLTGQPFAPTESTHGRHIWTFESREFELGGGCRETRETLLWDLAGQPGYRLIHQLHLNEVAVALVVFDARSETDPFAGVRHWDRALRQSLRLQGDAALPMKKFLVAARTDRGGISVSAERIEALVRDLSFDAYLETSAKEGRGIAELAEALQGAIDWEALPKVSSTELFQRIKAFLVREKESGVLLSTAEDLYRTFLKFEGISLRTEKRVPNLRPQFETCIGRVESRGLIQRLSFGDLVLLQPELLDAYASAMVNAAREEPDGLGCIAEEDALVGRFRMAADERIQNEEQEKLLLIATVEELLCHEIALREQTEAGPILVFPSQFTREWPEAPDPEGKAVTLRFDGPVLNVYATLAVRLSRSGIFEKREMWKNAAAYTATVGGGCGVWLREVEEGRGELTLFFDPAANEETRFQFEEYVQAHLWRRALPESIERRRIFVCPECATPVTERQAELRRERGFHWIQCNVCETHISLLDREERLAVEIPSAVPAMDRAADAGRELDAAISVLQGKKETGDFDVFLCHNNEDKPVVKKLGELLKEQGILPWLDEWELRPGLPWQRLLEQQIAQIKSAAVFVGRSGTGPWQNIELDAFLRQFVKRRCPVIPVILPDCETTPELPIFLEGMTWVDFRKKDPGPMVQLIWGITGERRLVR